MVRLPEIPGLQSQQINAPSMRPGAVAIPAEAGAEALGRVAQSIANVSDQFYTTAQHVQKLENARTVSEARQGLARDYAQHQLDLEADPDPASRMQKTAGFLSSYKGRMDSPDLPPAVRDELVQHFDAFATEATIRQAENSAKLASQRAHLSFQNEMQGAADAGDFSGAHAALGRAAATGLILPEEQAATARKIDQMAAYQSAFRSIAQDPIGAEQALQDPEAYAASHPNLTPENAYKLQHEAARAANAERSDFLNTVTINGDKVTETDLATMAENHLIDSATHASWLTKIRTAPEDLRPDPGRYEETYGAIMQYDPAADPSGANLASLRAHIAALPIPKEHTRTLAEKLTDRLTPEKIAKPGRNPHESAFNTKIDQEWNRGDFGKYRFPTGEKTAAGKPLFSINQKEYDASWKLTQQFKDEWRATLEALPPDTPFPALQTTYETLKKSFAARKPPPAISYGAIPPAPFDPAALRQSFGGQPVPPAGVPFSGAAVTAFGGKNDPADNGKSAFGGTTGAGGKEGAAVPFDVLKAQFPGKDKAWLAQNVRVVTRAANGIATALDLADLGTAEWVWQRADRPTLDLTEGAVRKLGGRPTYRDGKLTGHAGLPPAVDFTVVSIDTGGPLKDSTWEEAQAGWWKHNRPPSDAAAYAGLTALRQAWSLAKATP